MGVSERHGARLTRKREQAAEHENVGVAIAGPAVRGQYALDFKASFLEGPLSPRIGGQDVRVQPAQVQPVPGIVSQEADRLAADAAAGRLGVADDDADLRLAVAGVDGPQPDVANV